MAVAPTLTYSAVGIRESLVDEIYMISPLETPVFSAAKRGKAKNTLHDWQTDALGDATTNRVVEGDDAAFVTSIPTVRLRNYTQISRRTVQVSSTYEATNTAGRSSQLAYDIMREGQRLKQDIEKAITGNQASTAGGAASARSTAGLESWIASTDNGGNGIRGSGSSAGSSVGFVTATGLVTAPADGSVAGSTLTEANVLEMLALVWADGGKSDQLIMGTFQKQKFRSFTGNTASSGYYDAQMKGPRAVIVGGVDYYISDYGTHKLVLDRHSRSRTVLAITTEYLTMAWLDPISTQKLAKTGLSEKYQIYGEFALQVDNPNAHGKIADLATS